MVLYAPGPKARGEHIAAQKRLRTPRRGHEREEQLPQPRQEVPQVDHAVESLVSRLKGFGVAEEKARELVKNHREATEAQIAAYPYRDAGKARKNAAGWLIAAIEGNYTLPVAYLEELEKKQQAIKAKEQRSVVKGCHLCDEKGWRRIRTAEYLNGAMKRCSHDPDQEAKYPAA